MSMKDYLEAVKIIKEKPVRGTFFIGPRSEELVNEAEVALSLKFPPIYRRFLLEFGAGNFGSCEIYGITTNKFQNASVPNGIWYTLSERKESQLPNNYVVIYNTGDGELFCLDIPGDEKEAHIVTFEPGLDPDEQAREVVAEDFGSFLLQMINEELES